MQVLTIGILIFILIVIIAFILMKKVTHPRLYDTEYTLGIEKSKNYYLNFDDYPKEDYTVESYDSYVLSCTLIKNNSDKYVIITHGFSWTRCGSIKYTHIFYKLGYNVLIYDLRHHGENVRSFVSMGKNESRDIACLIKDLRFRFGDNILIGLHGESLGASSSIMCLDKSLNISFCVSDCAYSELNSLLKYQIKKNFRLPEFFVYISSFLCKVLYGFYFGEIRPIENLKNNEIPILFIHGKSDTFTPSYMSVDMYNACNGKKKLELFDRADHAESYGSNKERYEKVIYDFLLSCNVLNTMSVHLHKNDETKQA